MNDFTGVFGANPGVPIIQNRDRQPSATSATAPLPAVRDSARLGPAGVPDRSPTYPMTDVGRGDVNMFDPNIQVP